MPELYEADESQQEFQNEVYRQCDRNKEIRDYKASHPTYITLRDRDKSGFVCRDNGIVEYLECQRLGFITDSGFITDAGIIFLNADLEL